ncbi:MAG: helix-turn-helix transcriptional regulator [Kiritimatiellae bacterium]|nr:helix-turn-helix transcriptional regulator [Kiritimatiellia bacterium]
MKPRRRFEFERHPKSDADPRRYAGMKTYRGYPELMEQRLVFPLAGYSLVVHKVNHRIFEKKDWWRGMITPMNYLLHYCIAGRNALVEEGREVDYRPGRLFLIDRERLFWYRRGVAAFENFCLIFDVEEAAASDAEETVHLVEAPRLCVDLRPPRRRELETEIFGIVAAMHDRPPSYELRVREHVLGVLTRCMDWGVFRIVDHRRDGATRHWHHRLWVKRAARFVAARYREPISLREIGAAVGVSPSHLNKLFKAHTGKSLNRYVNEFRVQQAKALMFGGVTNMTEIALAVGFADPSYFSKRFRKSTGQSPRAFLRRIGGK